tara:strand:+ start:5127 stop:6050 length:924 start_codon:yes stop_codon:yes gene_type:complete
MQMSEAKAAHEADDGQVELEFTEEAQEVEIEATSDTEASSEPVVEESNDDEHEKYSQGVQKRINQLTKRAKEAEREREEALRYAQTIQTENTSVKQRLQSLDQNYITEYGNRVVSEQTRAKEELKTAIETGDVDRQMAAQERIAQLTLAADKHAQAKAQRQAQAEAQEQQLYTQQQPQYQPAPSVAAPDAKAEEWAEKNDWFGTDDAMTFAAFGLHKKLVQDEGFDPSSNDYYDALDSRMRDAFPHRFTDAEDAPRNNRSGQSVAGVSRNKSSGRGKKVRLSPSQVTIAKRLGVPLEEYAKYVKEGQ